MPWYTVLTPLRRGRGKEPLPPGSPVELDEAVGEPLRLLRAIEPGAPPTAMSAPAPPPPPPPPSPPPSPPPPPAVPREKPLGQQNKGELRATAVREEVAVAEHATNAQIVAAIEAKRAGAVS